MSDFKPIVFLDRDGTINIDTGYLKDPDQLSLIPGAGEGLGRLNRAGYRLVVVSNQSAIGRGLASVAEIESCNKALRRELNNYNVKLEDITYCPHHPEDNCQCRKPKTALVNRYLDAKDFAADLCWVVGDKQSDLEFGANIGIPASQQILVLSGNGNHELERMRKENDCIGEEYRCAADLGHAVEVILQPAKTLDS